ncbi:MAG: TetR/AcrR family transcriptional regulator [Deltaproteobacteria bacterium]
MELDTRQRILDAADQLFGEVGLDAAATRDIAERCGVNKALIHYHFSTKDELLVAVLDRYYARLTVTLERALAGDAGPRDRLVSVLEAYIDFLGANPGFFRIIQREIAGGRHVDRIAARMLPLFRVAETLITETWPATKKGPLSAAALLVSFYGMVITHFSYSPVVAELTGSDPLSPERLRRHKRHLVRMLDLVLHEIEIEHDTGEPATAAVAKRK